MRMFNLNYKEFEGQPKRIVSELSLLCAQEAAELHRNFAQLHYFVFKKLEDFRLSYQR